MEEVTEGGEGEGGKNRRGTGGERQVREGRGMREGGRRKEGGNFKMTEGEEERWQEKNRKARFDYELKDKYVAGISLSGTEVKSIKSGGCDLTGSYVVIDSDNNAQ